MSSRNVLLSAQSDERLLRNILKDAADVTRALAEKKPEDIRVPLFYQAHLMEVQLRLQEEGLGTHPLLKDFAIEMAKLTDGEADDIFTVSKAIHHLESPPEIAVEFGSVSAREKGQPAPANPYRKLEGLEPGYKKVKQGHKKLTLKP
jgi:hypothetical protein